MNDSTIRVMLVDDQELIRTGFRLMLLTEPDIEVVAEADHGQSALQQLAALRSAGTECDVAVMDVRMPQMDGIEATSRVVREFPDTRVLVLTTFDLDEYAIRAIQAGASGFLLKDVRPSELVDAIRRVAVGENAMDHSVTRRLICQLQRTDTHGVPVSTPKSAREVETDRLVQRQLEHLTEREREVLALIGEGKNNAEIAGELFLSASTVKTHVGRVLSKLELRDRIHAVIFAKEHGLA